jgi:hypothetical protein
MLGILYGIHDTYFFGLETLYFPLPFRRNVDAFLCHNRSGGQM